MGYRSTVALCLTEKGYDSIIEALGYEEEKRQKEVEDLFNTADERYLHTPTNHRLFVWKGIKWYEYYSDINFVINEIRELDYEDYRFVRIGEDSDDVEVSGFFTENPFNFDITINIKINADNSNTLIYLC